jgi:hypothetical protein
MGAAFSHQIPQSIVPSWVQVDGAVVNSSRMHGHNTTPCPHADLLQVTQRGSEALLTVRPKVSVGRTPGRQVTLTSTQWKRLGRFSCMALLGSGVKVDCGMHPRQRSVDRHHWFGKLQTTCGVASWAHIQRGGRCGSPSHDGCFMSVDCTTMTA